MMAQGLKAEIENSIEFKKRLIFEAAAIGEYLDLKLCAKHYYLHIEGSPECAMQTYWAGG